MLCAGPSTAAPPRSASPVRNGGCCPPGPSAGATAGRAGRACSTLSRLRFVADRRPAGGSRPGRRERDPADRRAWQLHHREGGAAGREAKVIAGRAFRTKRSTGSPTKNWSAARACSRTIRENLAASSAAKKAARHEPDETRKDRRHVRSRWIESTRRPRRRSRRCKEPGYGAAASAADADRAALLLLGGGYYWISSGGKVETDNAAVKQDIVSVSAQVNGPVVDVLRQERRTCEARRAAVPDRPGAVSRRARAGRSAACRRPACRDAAAHAGGGHRRRHHRGAGQPGDQAATRCRGRPRC